MSKIIFYGGVGATTGANFLLEHNGQNVLVDCGLLQGLAHADIWNEKDFAYDPTALSHLFVTHAHMDHIGRIPKLVRDGFRGRIVSTPETKEIASHLLLDAYKIMIMKEKSGTTRPYYEEKDIQASLGLWETVSYGEDHTYGNMRAVFKDAGHILGSAIVELTLGEVKIAFTGDLGNSPSPLLRDTENVTDARYMVIESVYGDRDHESKEERRKKFKKVVLETIKKGGELIIPAFSVDRTQVILYELNNMVEDGEIPSVPVFLDSPLASKVTEIYRRSTHLFNDAVQEEIKSGDDVLSFPKLTIIASKGESEDIENVAKPKIIIAGSGMSEGGRVLGHEARALLSEQNTVLLMGYQPVGTMGRLLEDGAREVRIGGEKIKVRAQIENVRGYSAHKDASHLLEFVEKAAESKMLKKVFVCMGEPHASLFLSQRIRDYLDIEAIYPEAGKEYILK